MVRDSVETTRSTYGMTLIGVLCVFTTGCVPAQPVRPRLAERPATPSPTAVPATAAVSAVEPGTLDELVQIAAEHHPDIRAARATVEAARGRLIQAGLYPNPSFGPNFAQLGDNANRLGQPGARWTQTIVTNGKLRIAKDGAARAVEAADWQAVTKWHDMVARVRLAYFETLLARRELATLGEIGDIADKILNTAERLEKEGVGSRPDVLRARVEAEQYALKREVAARRVESAEQNLLTALGRPTLGVDRFRLNPKDMEKPPPAFDWPRMLACVRETSSEMHEARSLIAEQERLVAKAKAEVMPNVTLTAIPSYESASRELRAEIIVQAPIPLFDRNQGNIHAAESELARAIAVEKQVELRLIERLTNAYQRYLAALKQTEAYKKSILPHAEASRQLIEAGYRAGDKKYDYSALLQAQQALAQARLGQTQALGELWRAVVDLAGILQQEHLPLGCGIREQQGVTATFGTPTVSE